MGDGEGASLRGSIPTMDSLRRAAAARSGGGGGGGGGNGGASAAPASAALPQPAQPPVAALLARGTGVFANPDDAGTPRPGPLTGPTAAPPPPPTYQHAFHRPGPAPSPHAPPAATPSLPTLFTTHPGSLVVSRRQAGNPLLPLLPPGRWVWGPPDTPADYYPAPDIHALFLSLRYHLLKPDYILARVRALAGPPPASAAPSSSSSPPPRLRLLLCQVDVDDPGPPLEGVNVLALRAGLTLICATSSTGAARWLDLYRSLAGAPSTAIAGRAETSAPAILAAALTGIRGVNQTDALTLGATFGSAAGIFSALPAALAAIPGIGPTKARRLADAFHTPFRRPLRQTRLDAVFGGGGGGEGGSMAAAAAAAAPAPAAPRPPLPPHPEVVVVGDDDEEAAPPPAEAAPTAAWAASTVAALDEFVYDDLDDSEVLEALGGGGDGED